MEEDIKLRILATAGELFKQFGIRSITMDEIASKLAMSKKTLYQYFKDKSDIVTQSVGYMMDEEQKIIHQIIDASKDAIGVLVGISQYHKQMVRSLNPAIFTEMERHYPAAWQRFTKYKECCVVREIMESIKCGQEEGFFRKEIDPKTIARLRLEDVMIGFDQRVFPYQEFDVPTVQMQIFDLFIYGLCTLEGHKKVEEYKTNIAQEEAMR